MSTMLNLVQRNLLVFFRDRAAVFFSFLSVIIIIGLYALFLADLQVSAIRHATGEVNGIRFLVDSWIMAGLLAVNTVTVSLGALAIMVRDRDNKVLRDFMVSPLNPGTIVASYILSSVTISMVISVVGLCIMEAYIYLAGGELLPVVSWIKVLAVLCLSVLNSTSFMFLIASFIRSTTAFSTLSTIVGTLIGFLTGIYVPLGSMPPAVQSVIKVFPTSHAAVMLRQIFMDKPLQMVFGHAPAGALEQYQASFGIVFKMGGHVITSEMMILYLAGLTVIFFALGLLRVRSLRLR